MSAAASTVPVKLAAHQFKLLHQSAPLLVDLLHIVGQAHLDVSQTLIYGDRVFTAGVVAAGPAVEFIPLSKLVRGVQYPFDVVLAGSLNAGEAAAEVDSSGRLRPSDPGNQNPPLA